MLSQFMEYKLDQLGCDETNVHQFSITIPVEACGTVREIRRNGVPLGTISLNITGRTFSCE